MYLSMVLLCILFVLFLFADNRITRLTNRLNIKIIESSELEETVTHQDNTIRSLENKIEQISTTDGISLEYREILDNLEKQNVKDKELLANYEIELSNCKELIDTLKSDIVALKSKPRTDRFKKIHVHKPSIASNIPLKEIPKRALIQAIYFIECSNLKLKGITFKEIVKALGYEPNIVNCRHMGTILRSMHFKVKDSRNGMLLLLNHDRNRKKLDKLYKKHCEN